MIKNIDIKQFCLLPVIMAAAMATSAQAQSNLTFMATWREPVLNCVNTSESRIHPDKIFHMEKVFLLCASRHKTPFSQTQFLAPQLA